MGGTLVETLPQREEDPLMAEKLDESRETDIQVDPIVETTCDISIKENTTWKQRIRKRLQKVRIPFVHDYVRVLFTNASFLCLFFSGFISEAGNFFTEIAIMTKVEEYFADSAQQGMALSVVFVAIFLPNLLLSPLAGTVADLVDRRIIMVTMDFLRIGLVLCFVLAENNFYVLMGLVVLVESANAIFDPARESMVPMVVPKEDLQISNAIESLSWFCCTMMGSSLGGFFTAQFGVRANFIADACTYLLSGILALCLFFTPELKDYKLIMKHGVDKVRAMKKSSTTNKDDAYALLDDDAIEQVVEEKGLDQPTQEVDPLDDDHREDEEHVTDVVVTEVTVVEEKEEEKEEVAMVGHVEETTRPGSRLQRLGSAIRLSLRELLRGIAFLLSNPFLWILASLRGMIAYQWAFTKFANVKYSDHIYVIGSSPAIFMAISRGLMGASSGLTPIFVERLLKPSTIHQFLIIILISLFISFLGDVIMSVAPHVSIYLIGCTIEAMGGGVLWVLTSTIQQKLVPTNFLGRCFSYDVGIMVMGGFVVGGLLSGILYDFAAFTPRYLSITTSIYTFMLVIFFFCFYLFFRKHANTFKPFIPTNAFPYMAYPTWSIYGASS